MGREKRNGHKRCVYVCVLMFTFSVHSRNKNFKLVVVPSSNSAMFLQVVSNIVTKRDGRPRLLAMWVLQESRASSVLTSYISSPLCSSLHEVMKGILFSQHIDKVFKHKELQQQLVDAKLQQTTQLIKEADEKHQREREFVSSVP